jgi:hypothetical protein
LVDIPYFVHTLSQTRPMFHSEADFQHALAWQIHQSLPEASLRLEYRPPGVGGSLYVDLWVEYEGVCTAVELKYRTRKLERDVHGESFSLRNQFAHPIGRYGFLKDIERLECIVCANRGTRGYALLLTNDPPFWEPPRSKSTIVDPMFRLHEGREISGTLEWDPSTGVGTKRKKEKAICLANAYSMAWASYSHISDGAAGVFKYLLLPVAPIGDARPSAS